MIGRRIRQSAVVAILVMASLAASHELIYLLAHGSSAEYARAMREGGHDRYWTSFVLIVAAVTIGLGAVAVCQIRRLHRQAVEARAGRLSVDDQGFRLFGRITVRLWLSVVVGVAVGFIIQENLETIAAGQPLPGANVVAGEHGLALPVIAFVSLLVAIVGALLRWGRHLLLARLRRVDAWAIRRVPRLPYPQSVDRPISIVAVCSNGLRAPPRSMPALL